MGEKRGQGRGRDVEIKDCVKRICHEDWDCRTGFIGKLIDFLPRSDPALKCSSGLFCHLSLPHIILS